MVTLSVVILFDWFSKTKATVLKRSTRRECVLCVCMLDKDVTVCLVVWGATFSSEMSCIFFLLSAVSSCQLIVLVALFVCLQRHTVGAKIKVPYVENPEL